MASVMLEDGRRVSAAVGDHDGEGAPRRGMVKMRGPEFATPRGPAIWPHWISRAGEGEAGRAIAAALQGDAGAHQADDRVAQSTRSSRFGGDGGSGRTGASAIVR